MGKVVIERITHYQYHSGIGDVRALTIRLLSVRVAAFDKVHKQSQRFKAELAGRKLK